MDAFYDFEGICKQTDDQLPLPDYTMAGVERIELPFKDSKSFVLPLDDTPMEAVPRGLAGNVAVRHRRLLPRP